MRRLAPYGLLCGFMSFVSGCNPSLDEQSASGLQATEYNAADMFLGLKDGNQAGAVDYFLSTADLSSVGVCLVSAGESCSPAHATYKVANEVHRKNGRRLLSTGTSVSPRAGSQIVVIAPADSQVLASFRFESLQDNNNATNASGVEAGLALIQEATLREQLTFLASDSFNGRLAATAENDKAGDWLIAELQKLDIKPLAGSDYRQKFTLRVGPTSGQQTANIIGVLPGQDPQLKEEYIVVGAHMDHAGTLQRGYTCSRGSGGADSICNGADDNGSGTIAVLNIAKALAAVRGDLKRSVIIMWFSGEEEGLLGSKHYVANPLVPNDKLVYMMNLDMVGYMESFGGLAALGGGTSTQGQAILERLNDKYPDVDIRVTDKAGGGSDHVPFMAKGIPGVFLHTGVENNKNYHRTSDTPDKVDYRGMTAATKIGFETLYELAATSTEVANYSLTGRAPLVTEEEQAQACHHLINNPFVKDIGFSLDFQYGNDGIE